MRLHSPSTSPIVMGKLARRGFITGIFAAVSGAVISEVQSPAIARQVRRRVTQSELDDAIEQHHRWLEEPAIGRRACFPNCDLSGLTFNTSGDKLVSLRGADFTEADLSGIVGGDINFHRASLQCANLSHSELRAPIFSGATLWRAICNDAVWGWATCSASVLPDDRAIAETACFMHTDFRYAEINRARVRGYFFDASLQDASLVDADLSFSVFAGRTFESETSFAGARLIRTNFRNATITAARFKSAVIQNANFAGATLEPDVAAILKCRHTQNLPEPRA